MTLSDLFKSVGAPLANIRWSWGAVRSSDGAVFLRVWQDETRRLDGRRFVLVADPIFFAGREDSLGYAERLSHLALIRRGAASFMIMCLAEDPQADPRAIKSFNRDDVFVGGTLLEADGKWWLELANRLPITSFRSAPCA
jgi:hypothetical protein